MEKLFTSESVTIGHPDKMCDYLADSILDAYLSKDKSSRVACEVCASQSKIMVMGEITSKAKVDIESLIRRTVNKIGYDNDDILFNGSKVAIIIDLNTQSPDIARGVNKKDIGAGDQGIMYGYATDETSNYMPLVHNLACKLAQRLEEVRTKNIIKNLRPDGKAQVTLKYTKSQIICTNIIISTQHDEEKDYQLLKEEITKEVINKVIPKEYLTKETKIFINPTGKFVIGGPAGDSGLTGRKLMVDTYGGLAHHGGGAFSGKDYTKVDRSAAYYARYVAKNIVASGLCHRCEVAVSYAIGVSQPLMITIDTFNTNIIPQRIILKIINKVFDFRPQNIIQELDLPNVKYTATTLYSHFGKNNLPWERLDKVPSLKAALKKELIKN